MALIYRAIWQDEPDGIHTRALDSFAWWVRKHDSGDRRWEVGVEETTGTTTTMIRAGSGEAGSIQRCTLHVDDGTARMTTTLITTSRTDGGASIWVDLERVSHRAFDSYRVQAPPLSTHLIRHGVRPHRGPVPLTVKPRPLRAEFVPEFTALLGDSARDLPVLVVAAGPTFDVAAWHEPARHCARVLAGSAALYVVGPVGRVNLEEILGSDLAVEPGGARLFLPGVAPDEPTPSRHRLLDAERVQLDPMAVAHTIIQLLAPAIAARRAPDEYPELRALLDQDHAAVRTERDELADRMHELERELASSENQNLELLADLDDASEHINLLQAALSRFTAAGLHGDPARASDPPPDVASCTAAAEAAQAHLTGIVLPDEACRDLAVLDQRIESPAWGRTAWRGLRALDAFAHDTEFDPGFWQWCRAGRSAFGWPASQKKLAMRESETVMSNDSLFAKRIFPVDPAVDAGGELLMEAHLKIAEGGNHQIPRIYFHDDRHGATGKVHIGFFGPHGHVPNTLS